MRNRFDPFFKHTCFGILEVLVVRAPLSGTITPKKSHMKPYFLCTIILTFLIACSPSSDELDPKSISHVPLETDEGVGRTYVLVHGASGGGWDWKTIDDLLSAAGHSVYRPTLAGLGEKVHLSNSNIDLTTHINDIANVIRFESLENVVLVGHSYGGMVITGVMDRMPERIKHAIFLDAAVPEDGMSMYALAKSDGVSLDYEVVDGIIYFPWLDASAPLPRDVPQSLKTYTEPVSFNNPSALKLPATFVAFIPAGMSVEERSADLSWQNAETRGWPIRTLESDHNAQRSHPTELVTLLEESVNNGD